MSAVSSSTLSQTDDILLPIKNGTQTLYVLVPKSQLTSQDRIIKALSKELGDEVQGSKGGLGVQVVATGTNTPNGLRIEDPQIAPVLDAIDAFIMI